MGPSTETNPGSRELNHHLGGLPDELRTTLLQAESKAQELGRTGLILLLRSQYPTIYEATVDASMEVERNGYALIDTGLSGDRTMEIPAVSLAIGAVLGKPTETDKVSRALVWPVTPRSVEYSVTTFSEDIGEAAMHTDSQFIGVPEDKFLLACINPDEQGGGTSELIDGSILRKWVEENDNALSDSLRLDYPFRVPTVFTEKLSDDEPEVIWRPIIDGDRIRYRYDTVMNALNLDGVNIPEDQLDSFKRFTQLLDRVPKVRHHLLSGEVIVVDNKRMLHARTDFSDHKRLLLRVRMNDENQV